MDFIFRLAEEFLKKHKKLNRYRRVFALIAAVVVFATTYELILPAITMDKRRAADTPGVEVGVAAEEQVSSEAQDAAAEEDQEEPAQAESASEEEKDSADAASETETAENTEDQKDSSDAENASEEDRIDGTGSAQENGEDADVQEASADAADVENEDAGAKSDSDDQQDSNDVDSSDASSGSTAADAANADGTEESAGASSTVTANPAEAEENANLLTTQEPVTAYPVTLTFEGKDYTITATFDEKAQLPADVRLDAVEILPDVEYKDENGNLLYPAYEEYYEQAVKAVEKEKKLEDQGQTVSTARFFDITFLDAEDFIVEPAAPVSIAVKYKDALSAVDTADTMAVHFDVDEKKDETKVEVIDTQTEVKKKEIQEISFEAEKFSVYGVLGTETITTNYITAEGDTYTITVTYDKGAEIPAGATLDVKEIVNGDKNYTDYVEQAAQALAKDEELPFVNAARLFDISIMADGKKVEPKAPVEVKIEYTKAENLNETSEVGAVHFKESTSKTETEVMDIDVQGEDGKVDGVTFTTDSFSIYAVIIIDKEAGTFVVEDENYKITIAYTKEANIPIGTNLIVDQIEYDSDEYWNLVDKTVEEINKGIEWEDRDQPDPRKGIADAVFFDISLVNGTKEIEPDAPLQVTIEYKNNGILVPQDEKAGVIHFGKTETQIIEELKLVTEAVEQQEGMPEDLRNGEIITSMTYEQEGFSPVGTYSTTVYLGDAVDDNAPRRALASPKAGETHISASKTVEDLDNDGIYELALSVTGASDTTGTTTVSKSNVIIVMDTSSSMNNGRTYVSYKYDEDTYDSNAQYYQSNNQNRRLYWRDTRTGWYTSQYGGTRYGGAELQVYRYDTWLNAEKEALYSLINALLSKNEDREQDGVSLRDIVEISLIDFNDNAENRVTHYDNKRPSDTTNEAQLDSIISGMGYETGTNWEDGLFHAYKEASWYQTNQADESVHIIFLTDGSPFNYNNYNGSGEVTGNTHSNSNSTPWTNASDDARKLVYDNGELTGWSLYGIFTYAGKSDGAQLKNLINYAYTGTGNRTSPVTEQNFDTYTITNEDKFYYASDTSGLLNYFQKVIDSVTNTVGYAGVEWEDGVTLGVTNTSVTVDGTIHESSITYKVKSGNTTLYTVKIADGVATFNISGQEETLTDNTPETVVTKIDPDDSTTWITSTVYSVTVGDTEYKMSPATIDPTTGLVDWDLAGIGILENGYTYEMTFDIWPNQFAYDLVADLNNGVKDFDDIKEELIAEHGEEDGTALYNQIAEYLIDNGDGTYSTVTNWKQEVNYYTADVEKDEDGNVISTTYTGHDPYKYDYRRTIALTSDPLILIKEWNSSIDESQKDSLLWKDYPANTEPTEYQVTLHVWKADTATELQNLIDQYAGNPDTASAHDYLDKTLGWNSDLQEYVWTSQLAIAPGTMVSVSTARDEMGLEIDEDKIVSYDYDGDGETEDYYIVEAGHYYFVTEDDIDWHFELETIVYHPMLVNGELCNVTFETDESGNVTGVENIDYMTEVQATNSKTAELDITKKIVDKTGKMTQAQMDAETFTYKVTLTVPKDADMSHTNALEWVARYGDDVSASNRYHVHGYQSDEDASLLGLENDVARFNGKVYGQYTVSYPGGGATLDEIFNDDDNGTTKSGTIYITLMQNEIIRFTNLPSGTQYTIEEMYNNLYQANPSRDADANLDDAPESNVEANGYTVSIETKNGSATASGRVVTGTIDELDKRYYNQFTNTLNDTAVFDFDVTKHLQGYEWSGEKYYLKLAASGENTPLPRNTTCYLSAASGTDDVSFNFGNVHLKPGTYTYTITETASDFTEAYSGKVVNGVTYDGVKTIKLTVANDLSISITEGSSDGVTYDSETNTVKTTVTNKTLPLSIYKIGGSDVDNKLEGVEFKLYSDAALITQVTQDARGNAIGTDGVITTGSDGTAAIGILNAGTYYLVETGLGNNGGYNMLADAVEITVGDTIYYKQTAYITSEKYSSASNEADLVKSNGGMYINYADDGTTISGYTFTINNTTGEKLPHTGGPGTLLYTLGGFALIGAAALMYGFRMRRRERRLN